MNLHPISRVTVKLNHLQDRKTVGRLALKNRQLYFEYSHNFLQSGLELSPFKLPLKPGVQICEDLIFNGLFGVFNDSLPDGWGQLLLDRKLLQLGLHPNQLSPLDRLCYVGSNGMGALNYEPDIGEHYPIDIQNLDTIAEEIYQTLDYDNDSYLDELLTLNGSSAGARPKIMLKINQENWLVKFPSSMDPKDIGAIEFSYHLMAKQAGLEVPAAKLFPAKKGAGYFGVQRFDRGKDGPIHMHSISGLLHVDHRLPHLDYETIIRATHWLTKNVKETEKQFRAAVFNILSHNRDDHAKNFSFLLTSDNQWSVSPAYDLTFSAGPNGEHCTMVMGEGRNPELKHLLSLANIASLKETIAIAIIDEVKTAISQWTSIATHAGVSKKTIKSIQSTINAVNKNIVPAL